MSFLERVAAGEGGLDKALRTVVPFGKFKGRTLSWALQQDAAYLAWLAGQHIESTTFRDALRLVLTANDDLVKTKQNEAEVLR